MSTRRRQSSKVARPAAHVSPASQAPNVVDLRMRVLPRHMETASRWLEAGRTMGLCDAASYGPDDEGREYVLVWVRENADPAYMISPDGRSWTVRDCVRDQPLARVASFEDALRFIRPVLPLTVAA